MLVVRLPLLFALAARSPLCCRIDESAESGESIQGYKLPELNADAAFPNNCAAEGMPEACFWA